MAYWLMLCRHRDGVAALRDQHREAHRAHVASGGGGMAKVLTGSALTLDDAETATGNFGVLEAPTREAALAFAQSDPYARAGIVESIEIVALASRFQAQRIDPLTRS
ncbi:MAG: YciI family protein [Alsobacter sp.]